MVGKETEHLEKPVLRSDLLAGFVQHVVNYLLLAERQHYVPATHALWSHWSRVVNLVPVSLERGQARTKEAILQLVPALAPDEVEALACAVLKVQFPEFLAGVVRLSMASESIEDAEAADVAV